MRDLYQWSHKSASDPDDSSQKIRSKMKSRLTRRKHRRNKENHSVVVEKYQYVFHRAAPFGFSITAEAWIAGMKKIERKHTGPMMVACHWNRLSPIGPAEQDDGGSRPRSINSWMKRESPKRREDSSANYSNLFRSKVA